VILFPRPTSFILFLTMMLALVLVFMPQDFFSRVPS